MREKRPARNRAQSNETAVIDVHYVGGWSTRPALRGRYQKISGDERTIHSCNYGIKSVREYCSEWKTRKQEFFDGSWRGVD